MVPIGGWADARHPHRLRPGPVAHLGSRGGDRGASVRVGRSPAIGAQGARFRYRPHPYAGPETCSPSCQLTPPVSVTLPQFHPRGPRHRRGAPGRGAGVHRGVPLRSSLRTRWSTAAGGRALRRARAVAAAFVAPGGFARSQSTTWPPRPPPPGSAVQAVSGGRMVAGIGAGDGHRRGRWTLTVSRFRLSRSVWTRCGARSPPSSASEPTG